MPTQPPRFRAGIAQARRPWSAPGRNAHRRKRGRAGVDERRRILAEEPLCRRCLANGLTVASQEVDHVDEDLPDPLWDARENKQALCSECNRRKMVAKCRAERRPRPGRVGDAAD
ncbi:MAG: 5-methylcytosine-specific restriction enzyme [Sphingomonadales bacterium]|nr:5-methylcytosine-specific restriction enzyme [Sphingomonadales bacterium]